MLIPFWKATLMMSLAGSLPTSPPMVSPKGQDGDISLCSVRGDKTRTAANREQGNPQASGPQTPERHVFGIECYESVLERVVGGHGYHSILFAMGG